MTRKKFFAMLTAAPLAAIGAVFGTRTKTIAEWIPPKPHSLLAEFVQIEDVKDQFHGDHQRCPHCHEAISLKDAAVITHGDGFVKYVCIKLPTGQIGVVEVGDFNPKTMELP